MNNQQQDRPKKYNRNASSGWATHCGSSAYRPGQDRGWQAEALELLGARIQDPSARA